MKKNPTLYSLFLPLFWVLSAPKTLYGLLPLNFLIDVAVVYVTLKSMERPALFPSMWKKEIWLCALFSLAGTCIGGAALFGLSRVSATGDTWQAVTQGVSQNPFSNTNALLAVFFCIILAAAFTYVLTLWLALRKTDMLLKEKRAFALSFAMFTAPYAFILPTVWFVG